METKLHDAVYWTLSCAKHRKEIEIEGGAGEHPKCHPPGLAAPGHRLVFERNALGRWGWPCCWKSPLNLSKNILARTVFLVFIF